MCFSIKERKMGEKNLFFFFLFGFVFLFVCLFVLFSLLGFVFFFFFFFFFFLLFSSFLEVLPFLPFFFHATPSSTKTQFFFIFFSTIQKKTLPLYKKHPSIFFLILHFLHWKGGKKGTTYLQWDKGKGKKEKRRKQSPNLLYKIN